MFTHQVNDPSPREVAFDPSDEIYHLSRQTRNPYLERTIAPAARKLDRSPEDLHKLFRLLEGREVYRVAPSNTGEPYRRRDLHHPPPPPSIRPGYVKSESLTGDLVRLPWMIEVFFAAVLSRLKDRPGEFKAMVEELIEQFQHDRMRIKVYDAYRTFTGWRALMATLEEISRYPAPETFDLFCSALFAYYDLIYPPGQAGPGGPSEPAPDQGLK